MRDQKFYISIFRLFLNYLTCDNIDGCLNHFFKGVEVELFLLRELHSLYFETFTIFSVLL